MKNLFFYYSTFIFLFCVVSCDNDDSKKNNFPIKETADYLPSHIGNYWIYDVYIVHEDGTERFIRQDSVTITKKENSNGKEYSYMEYLDNPETKWIYSDSAGYLIDKTKGIFFSNINFSDTILTDYHVINRPYFADTLAVLKSVMKKIEEPFTVPAGTFEVLNIETNIFICLPFTTVYESVPPADKYFAKDIGIVFERGIFLMTTNKEEKRLSKYCINGVVYPK